jgi:hypothetical protein
VEEMGYRELDRLIDEGAGPAALRAKLAEFPPELRSELSRYAWGILDRRFGPEDEAALWLYAWTLSERSP